MSWMVFAINGSELLSDPIRTVFSPFTNLIGVGFYLVFIGFIATALYIKNRDLTSVSGFIIASSLLLGTGNIFIGNPEMAFVFYIITVMGFVGVVVSIYFMRE